MARTASKGEKKKRRNSSNEDLVEVTLTRAEVEVVVSACRKYRQTIPVYIASRQEEAQIIDAVLKKLV
jgi:hypothetical protein